MASSFIYICSKFAKFSTVFTSPSIPFVGYPEGFDFDLIPKYPKMSDAENNESYRYWVRWQFPVCALILVVTILTALMHIIKAKAEPLSYNHLWLPCWRNLNPLWLLLCRAVAFVLLAHIHFDIVALDGAFSFYFYTQWTLSLVTIYFALGTIVSAYGCWQFVKKPPLENEERAEFLKRDLKESMSANTIAYKEKETNGSFMLQSRYVKEEFKIGAGFWGYLMQTTYQTCAGAVILTDIVFWCVIVPFLSTSHFKLNMLMSLMHTLNALFLLLDTALNNLPFPWFRLAYFVLWSCGYIIFQWILHACGFTWWPYPFLELNTPWAPLWYSSLAVIHIPCYCMYSLIVKAKNTILPKLFPHAFLRSY